MSEDAPCVKKPKVSFDSGDLDEEVPLIFESEVVDFTRPRPDGADCVAVLRGPNDIAAGFGVYHAPLAARAGNRPFVYAETFSGASQAQENGEMKTEPVGRRVFLLDRALSLSSKVMRFENKHSDPELMKKGESKRGLAGIITAIQETADIRILGADGQAEEGGRIIRGVSLNGVKTVRETVSHRYDLDTVVYGNMRCRVRECLFECLLRDPEGQKLIVKASCKPDSEVGIRLRRVGANGQPLPTTSASRHDSDEARPIIPGDRVKIQDTGKIDLQLLLEWPENDAPEGYNVADTVFTVEKMEMHSLQVREIRTTPIRGGSLGTLQDQLNTSAPANLEPSQSSGLSPLVANLQSMMVDIGMVSGLNMSSVSENAASTSATASMLSTMQGDLGFMANKLAAMRARRENLQQIPGLWIQKRDLNNVHFLDAQKSTFTVRNPQFLDFHLDGKYEAVSHENYNRLLVDELKNVFSGEYLSLDDDQKPLVETVTFTNKKCIGEVVRRRTLANILWFDGTTSAGVPSYQLVSATRKAHPTENAWCPGLFVKNPVKKELWKAAGSTVGDSLYSEFGLVTVVREHERILVVRFYRKKDSANNALYKYEFAKEEELGFFDVVRHSQQRIALGSHVRLLNADPAEELVDTIGTVVSNSDNGYQLVKVLSGKTKEIWPGDVSVLSYAHAYYSAYDDYYDMDFEFPPAEDDGSYEDLLFAPPNQEYGGAETDYPASFEYEEDTIMDENYSNHELGMPAAMFAHMDFDPSAMAAACGPSSPRLKKIDGCGGKLCHAVVKRVTKRMETKIACPERLTAYAALRLTTYPESPCQKEFKDASALDTAVVGIIDSQRFSDARMYISYFLKEPGSEEERAEFAGLKQKYPEWEVATAGLFAINDDVNLSDLAISTVGHLQEITPRRLDKEKRPDAYGYEYCAPSRSNILVFPADAKEIPEKIAKVLDGNNRASGSHLAYLTGHRNMQHSYWAPSNFKTIALAEGKGVFHAQFSDYYQAIGIISLLKQELGEGVFVVTEIDAYMMDGFMATQLELQEGRPPTTHPIDDATRFHWNGHWEGILMNSIRWQSFLPHRRNPVNDDSNKILNLDFNFKSIANVMGFNEEVLTTAVLRNNKDQIDALQFSAPSISAIKVPLTLKLEVASGCNGADLTDSFLAFSVLSQIQTSSTWPSCTITIQKEHYDGNSVQCNFVRAYLVLRNQGLLSGPYFNFSEAKILAKAVADEYIKGEGELTEGLGAEVVADLCKMMKKLTHISSVGYWQRLNAVEEHFPIEEIISQIRHMISHPDVANESIIPASSLKSKLASTPAGSLRDELRSWVPEEVGEHSAPTGSFTMVESVGQDHKYYGVPAIAGSSKFMATIRKEQKLLKNNLTEGLHVIGYEDRMNLFRAIIVGPPDSPYESVPFIFDINLPSTYPAIPPQVHYQSYAAHALNPNLYMDGKVCLSLLGTWTGKNPTEMWDPVKSTIFQTVFSIHAEIMMTDSPYFKEPGYEIGSQETESKKSATNYNGMAIVATLENLVELLKKPPADVAPILIQHFKDVLPTYLPKVRSWLDKTVKPRFPVVMDKGLILTLNRLVDAAQTAFDKLMNPKKAPEAAVTDGPSTSSAEPSTSSAAQIEASPAPAVDPEEKRTLFSEGDPMAGDGAEFKNYVLLRLVE